MYMFYQCYVDLLINFFLFSLTWKIPYPYSFWLSRPNTLHNLTVFTHNHSHLQAWQWTLACHIPLESSGSVLVIKPILEMIVKKFTICPAVQVVPSAGKEMEGRGPQYFFLLYASTGMWDSLMTPFNVKIFAGFFKVEHFTFSHRQEC